MCVAVQWMLLRPGFGGAALHVGSDTGLPQEFNRRFYRLHQVPATPVHTTGKEEGGEENEEEQAQRASSNWFNQRQVAAIKVSGWLTKSWNGMKIMS